MEKNNTHTHTQARTQPQQQQLPNPKITIKLNKNKQAKEQTNKVTNEQTDKQTNKPYPQYIKNLQSALSESSFPETASQIHFIQTEIVDALRLSIATFNISPQTNKISL